MHFSSLKRVINVIALILINLAFVGCEMDELPTPSISIRDMPIEGGAIDRLRRSVVAVRVLQSSAGWTQYYKTCTGTLIAPNLVITAQHCIAESTGPGTVDCDTTTFLPPYEAESISVTTEFETFPRTGQVYQVQEVVIPDLPPDQNLMCGSDIALLILEENVPTSDTIPLIPRLDAPVQRGEKYRIIGFGATSVTSDDSGIRHQRDGLTVECISNECPSYTNVQFNEFQGSEGTCSGDSGGTSLDSEERLLGILSRSEAGTCRNPTYAGVYQWRDFIREHGYRAHILGGYEPPSWIEALGDLDGDTLTDGVDNCPTIANTDQRDADGDSLGDLCDAAPGVAMEDCNICEECRTDSDCESGRGICVPWGWQSYCFVECSIGCPTGTSCFSTTSSRGSLELCLNEHASSEGVCPSSFTCRSEPEPIVSDCDICASCAAGCDGGICLTVNNREFCSQSCSTTTCPTTSVCFEVPLSDGSVYPLCLNPGADLYDIDSICPESYTCGT